MAKLQIQAGSTSQSVNIFVQDSSSTVGAGLGGIAPAGGALLSGFQCYYSFTGTNAGSVVVSLSVPAAVNSAYSSGQVVQIDNTNQKGLLRFDIPNAAIASGNGRVVTFYFSGGTNVAPCLFEIELTAINNQSTGFGLVNASANAVQINGVTTSSVTTINANIGTTQAITFDGNNLPSINIVDINGAAVVETGLTMLQAMRLIASTTGAKLSGAGSGTETFRNAVADSANRVIATVDSSGNRTAITYNL